MADTCTRASPRSLFAFHGFVHQHLENHQGWRFPLSADRPPTAAPSGGRFSSSLIQTCQFVAMSTPCSICHSHPPRLHVNHERTKPEGHPSPGCTVWVGDGPLHPALGHLALVAPGGAVTMRYACSLQPLRCPPWLRLCRVALGSSRLRSPWGAPAQRTPQALPFFVLTDVLPSGAYLRRPRKPEA